MLFLSKSLALPEIHSFGRATSPAQHTPLAYPEGSWLCFTPFTPLPALQEMFVSQHDQDTTCNYQKTWLQHAQNSILLHLLCLFWFLNIHNFFQLFSITRSFNKKMCITFLILFRKTEELSNSSKMCLSQEPSDFQNVRRKLSAR